MRVAAFDVDGTLTERDCVVPFLRRIGGARAALDVIGNLPRLVSAGVRRDRDRLKALVSSAVFRRTDAAVVHEEAVVFAGQVRTNWMREDTVRQLAEHLEAGDAVVLVSASFEAYLLPLAAHLGVSDVLATRLAVDSSGVLTGALDGGNCRGQEKVNRLHRWLDEYHGGRGAVHVIAYGDSAGDRELLLDADEARWVGKGATPQWLPRSAQAIPSAP